MFLPGHQKFFDVVSRFNGRRILWDLFFFSFYGGKVYFKRFYNLEEFCHAANDLEILEDSFGILWDGGLLDSHRWNLMI